MSDSNRPANTEITLLGKSYVIACPPEEQENLRRSARYLDKAMHGIHARGKVMGSEKIAVMAALNITHELIAALDESRANEKSMSDWNLRLASVLAKSKEPRDSDVS